jgi:hypothetical protein
LTTDFTDEESTFSYPAIRGQNNPMEACLQLRQQLQGGHLDNARGAWYFASAN